MPIVPVVAESRITLEDLAEIRRARVVRRRLFLGFLAASFLVIAYAGWKACRHFVAASWLEATDIGVAWSAEGESWKHGGASSVWSRQPRLWTHRIENGVDLAPLMLVHRVEDLDLANLAGVSGLRDSYLDTIANLRELRRLNLDQTHSLGSWNPDRSRLTDVAVAKLKGLRHLADLSLAGSRVTDAGIAQIETLPELETLDLAQTRITDASLESLRRIRSLKSLILTNTGVTPLAVQAFENARPDVRVLSDATYSATP